MEFIPTLSSIRISLAPTPQNRISSFWIFNSIVEAVIVRGSWRKCNDTHSHAPTGHAQIHCIEKEMMYTDHISWKCIRQQHFLFDFLSDVNGCLDHTLQTTKWRETKHLKHMNSLHTKGLQGSVCITNPESDSFRFNFKSKTKRCSNS